jgi:hypothetical protein
LKERRNNSRFRRVKCNNNDMKKKGYMNFRRHLVGAQNIEPLLNAFEN